MLEEFVAARMGLEPFDELFTAEHLRGLATGSRAPIKALLLDQRKIAGVGNEVGRAGASRLPDQPPLLAMTSEHLRTPQGSEDGRIRLR